MSDKNYDPQNCGIYCWRNKTNGKRYVGKSKDLHHRKLDFLRFNHNYAGDYINKARRKYNSEEYWEYSILEYCSPKELNHKEQEYISIYKTFNPKYGYNLSTGGEGGAVFSEITKKKLSEIRKGEKNHFYNKHHNEESKKKIADANSIPIEQYDLEGNFIREWKSATEAGRVLKISDTSIGRCCIAKSKSCGNYQWKRKGSDVVITSIIPKTERPIYQIDSSTGEIIKEWSNPTEVVNVLNLRRDGLMKCLDKTLKRCHKYYWCYVYEYEDFAFETFKVDVKRRVIYQIDRYSYEIIAEWESATEAGKKLNINSSAIAGCCNGRSVTAGNFRWRYKDNSFSFENSIGRNNVVYQIDKTTNEVIKEWKSATEAGSYLHIDDHTIRACCNGELKTYSGYKWQYKGSPKPYNKVNHVKRAVYQIDIKSNEIIAEWESATEAAEKLHITRSSITACCKGRLNKTGGFKWRYATQTEPELTPEPTQPTEYYTPALF